MKCARPECGHPRAIHAGDGCRIGGCTCAGFSHGQQRPNGPRRIAVDVPDGYVVSVVLTPVGALVDETVTVEASTEVEVES